MTPGSYTSNKPPRVSRFTAFWIGIVVGQVWMVVIPYLPIWEKA